MASNDQGVDCSSRHGVGFGLATGVVISAATGARANDRWRKDYAPKHFGRPAGDRNIAGLKATTRKGAFLQATGAEAALVEAVREGLEGLPEWGPVRGFSARSLCHGRSGARDADGRGARRSPSLPLGGGAAPGCSRRRCTALVPQPASRRGSARLRGGGVDRAAGAREKGIRWRERGAARRLSQLTSSWERDGRVPPMRDIAWRSYARSASYAVDPSSWRACSCANR